MTEDNTNSNKLVAIYFDKKTPKEKITVLADRARADKAQTILTWSHLFTGPDDLRTTARAVIIQAGAPRADLIAKCYKTLAHDVELHWVDENLEFIDEPQGNTDDGDSQNGTAETDPTVQDDPTETDEESTDDLSEAESTDDSGAGESEEDEAGVGEGSVT